MRRGCAHVKGLYNWPDDGEQVANGSQAIWDTGLRVVKLYLTPDYATDYPEQDSWTLDGSPVTPTTLTELAQTDQFTAELERGWHTMVFTVFTFANGSTNWWRTNPSVAKMTAEYTELRALAEHLAVTYPNVRFYLQNWEGDWAFMDSFSPNTYVPEKQVHAYAAFLGTRQRAVADARAAAGGHVFNAVELNRVVDARLYPHRRRILTDLASRIQPDVVSYSAYDSTIVDQGSWGADLSSWQAATEPVFRKALRAIKAAFPNSMLQIGEFGFPENEVPYASELSESMAVMIEAIDTIAEEEGAFLNLYWQVFDNEPGSGGDVYRGYWFVDDAGNQTETGLVFQNLGPGED